MVIFKVKIITNCFLTKEKKVLKKINKLKNERYSTWLFALKLTLL